MTPIPSSKPELHDSAPIKGKTVPISVYHREILREIKQLAAQEGAPYVDHGDNYIGSTKPCYFIRTALVRRMAKDWIRRHPELAPADYLDLFDSLAQGESSNEFSFVGILVEYLPRTRQTLEPRHLDRWLERAEGWEEVDSICQSTFTAEEMLANWKEWKSLLVSLSKSQNVHKRRASLVLLTKPLRESADPRLARLAFANIGKLKSDKDILITKAISWLLRALIKYHRQEVENYLKDNSDSLPKIALRETRNKLKSGRKSGRM